MSAPLEPAVVEACTDKRWIGERLPTSPTCPMPTAPWQGGQMFTNAPPGLSSFCVYEWSLPTAPAVAALPADGPRAASSWLRRDCQVSAPLGVSPPLDHDAVAERFRAEAGGLPALPAWPPRQVAVAVLDSSPDSWWGIPIGELGHGHAVGSIIHDLTCPQGYAGPCATYLHSSLALPLVDVDRREPATGGTFGTQGDLALALWRTLSIAGGQMGQDGLPVPLVINLSLGWDPRWQLDGDVPGPVESVRRALEMASCQGALVFAAAGNDPGGTALATGPMYPAAWESTPAPDPGVCASLYWTQSGQEAPNRPLVYAVGGVAGGQPDLGKPLPNSRIGSTPRLTAPGKLATASGFDWSTWSASGTDVLTGTSASTAVVSAAAALLWAYQPGVHGSVIVDQLVMNADPTGRLTDFGLEGPGVMSRRIHVCRALERAGVFGGCGPAAWEMPPPPVSPWTPYLTSMAYAGVVPETPPVYEPRWVDGPCARAVRSDGAESDYEEICPDRALPNAVPMPYVGPQPNEPPCPSCLVHLRPWENLVDVHLQVEEPLGATLSALSLVYTTWDGTTGSVALGRTGATYSVGTPYVFSEAGLPVWEIASAAVVLRITTGSILTIGARRSVTITVPVYTW